MNRPLLLSGQFRHIVVPGEVKRRPRVINLAAAHEAGLLADECATCLSEENLTFLDGLFRQAGLRMRLYRPETLGRRLPACLRALRVRSTAQARRLLEEKPALVATALNAMLVGVTWFFRDLSVFDMLREYVLPTLAGERKSLHIWSVGCSEGAELYSLALLLAEMNLLSDSYLLGTDCRADAIDSARRGCFDAEAVKGVPPGLLTRYFTRHSVGWQICSTIHAAVRWSTADVLQASEPGIWDLILCRNTAMYLRAEAASFLWDQFESLLRPGGVLVLGKAERPTGSKRLSLLGPCIYRRNRG